MQTYFVFTQLSLIWYKTEIQRNSKKRMKKDYAMAIFQAGEPTFLENQHFKSWFVFYSTKPKCKEIAKKEERLCQSFRWENLSYVSCVIPA